MSKTATPVERPSKGGSYIRDAKGALELVQRTRHRDDTPADPAPASSQAPVSGADTPAPQPKKGTAK